MIPGLTLHGPRNTEERGGAISFSLEGIHPHDAGTIMDQYGVAIRAGQHCAQILMRHIGVHSTSRASFYLYNGEDDIDSMIDAIGHVQKVFA